MVCVAILLVYKAAHSHASSQAHRIPQKIDTQVGARLHARGVSLS